MWTRKLVKRNDKWFLYTTIPYGVEVEQIQDISNIQIKWLSKKEIDDLIFEYNENNNANRIRTLD